MWSTALLGPSPNHDEAAVPPGRTVRARGTVDRCGRTLAYLGVTVHDGDRLVATGQIVKAIVPSRDGG